MTDPTIPTNGDVMTMLRAYLDCAVWLIDEEYGRDDGQPWSRADLARAAEKAAYADVLGFLTANADDIGEHFDHAGHDLWLTRNGHGTGFWDREEIYGEEEAARLSEAATAYGGCDLYPDDDGLLHFS